MTGEEVDVQGGAVGRRGAVVVGEEGAAAVGRYGGGVVVGERYESYEAWRAVAAVGAGIAIGTMLAKPPAAAAPVVVSNSTYYYHDNTYYTRVMTSGDVSYQVVEAPSRGAIITTLPAGCKNVTRRRDLLAVRRDLLHARFQRLPGRRPAVTATATEPQRAQA